MPRIRLLLASILLLAACGPAAPAAPTPSAAQPTVTQAAPSPAALRPTATLQAPTATPTRTAPTPTSTPTARPASPTPTAPTSTPTPATPVQIVSVIGGPPRGTATVSVQTTPGAECRIEYVTPAGTSSRAQGLADRTADAEGRAAWTWNIGANTRPGTGRVTVRCGGGRATAEIRIG